MRLLPLSPFVFLIISALLSPFGAQDFPLGLPEKPSPATELELEPSEVEILGFSSEIQIPELSDNEIEDYLNEILNSGEDWDEGLLFQETPELSEDFEDFNVKYQPRRKRSTSSGFREIREEKQEIIRNKRQIYNNRNYQRRRPQQQFQRGPRYQTNNRRRNQNFRGNQRQPRVNNRNYRVNPKFNRNQFRGNQRNYAQGRGNRNFYGRNMNSLRNGQNRARDRGRSRNRNRNNQGILGFLGLGNLFGFGGSNRGSRNRGRGRSRNRGSSYQNQIQGGIRNRGRIDGGRGYVAPLGAYDGYSSSSTNSFFDNSAQDSSSAASSSAASSQQSSILSYHHGISRR